MYNVQTEPNRIPQERLAQECKSARGERCRTQPSRIDFEVGRESKRPRFKAPGGTGRDGGSRKDERERQAGL